MARTPTTAPAPPMNPSVVIYGPAGCGKTVNSHRLARHFGLSHIIDGDLREGQRVPAATLVLVTSKFPPIGAGEHLVISFAKAMRLAGYARSPATDPQPHRRTE